MTFANSGGFGRIRYATMDYVNYVCQSVYNCYPRWWGGMLVMGRNAVMPIQFSLWEGLCGQLLRSTITSIRVSHMREPMQFGL